MNKQEEKVPRADVTHPDSSRSNGIVRCRVCTREAIYYSGEQMIPYCGPREYGGCDPTPQDAYVKVSLEELNRLANQFIEKLHGKK